jgi:Baseplate J-like protein
MTTIKLVDSQQVIDYTARDYSSFRQEILSMIPAKLPEWSDLSEADFGVVLIEMFSYMADILSYYQDRIANEAFLSTAQQRRSVIEHLRLIGYEMSPAAPASAALSIIVGNNQNQVIEIRNGDRFATATTPDRPSVTFEYTDDKPLVIDLSQLPLNCALKPDGTPMKNFKEAFDVIPVVQGRTVLNEVIGVSDGTPNQSFPLAQPSVIQDSIQIVMNTTPPTPAWNQRQNLIFSPPAYTPEQLQALQQQDRIGSTLAFSRSPDPDFAAQVDENDIATVLFGDGQYGQIPPSNTSILATYRTGGGSVGNVGAGQITNISESPQLQVLGAKVTNRLAASGGAERETTDQAIKFAPTIFSSMQRAVTANDYVAQARLYPGVSKARAQTTNWNLVKLYVAPTGDGEFPTDTLKTNLLEYFEDKRMLTTSIQIEDPDYVRIQLYGTFGWKPYFRPFDVQTSVIAAMNELFDFDNADFGQTLYLSTVYQVIEALPGIDHVFVSRFNRADAAQDINSDGRIVLGQNEIAVLRAGDLQIQPESTT